MTTLPLISAPDSPLVADLFPSPNIEPRFRGLTPSILILHYTGLESVERSLDVLSRPDCKVSCHYVVDVDGRVVQMVAEEMRAWHAGVSSWHGEADINSASIGIEIQNPGHALGYPEFPEAQMRAVIALSQDICGRHGIAPERVLAHSDIAPSRKIDPGEKFDWRRMAEEGVGFWVPPEPVDADDAGIGPDADGPDVAEARRLLARYGYGVAAEGPIDTELGFILRAFQLHFRPARVDSRLDRSTLVTLRRLVDALPDVAVG
ncbi:MAG: N-acetylmuramoyl-L-alanine amidase [Hyphomicrobium sp. 32-62-53]|nr:MAG: N-acetylmuramoyl-L-alanine amidase [Hyphomicrobium sp. 12-62-95]OYX99296.1 MAG: N-acetylmuramoyl-L-alanine amidase [Hyphomicrobium sp. 32-62-53]